MYIYIYVYMYMYIYIIYIYIYIYICNLNKIFENLKRRGFVSEKRLKYIRFDFKSSCNSGKLYFLPKIHKQLPNIHGRPVISNCGTPTEKLSEFLDNHLQSTMRNALP